MKTNMFFYIVSLFICLFFKKIGVDDFYLSLIFIILSTIVTTSIVLKLKTTKRIKIIILVAYTIRCMFMMIDLYCFRLPHANSDDEAFYKISLFIYNDPTLIFKTVARGFYPKFLYFFYIFIGTNRMGIQYTNVLFSTLSIIILIKILNELNISEKAFKIAVYMYSFMPNIIFLNSILRRDTIISLLTIVSIYYCVKWFNNKEKKYIVLSIVYIIFAMIFHVAMIFTIPVYIVFYTLYDKQKDKLKINGFRFIIFVCFSMIAFVLGLYYFNNYNNKLMNITSEEKLYETVTNTRGGSAYLTNIKINNMYQLIMFTPLKVTYFLFSPMLWSVRGISDLSTIILDSSIYIALMYIFLKNKKNGFSSFLFYAFFIITIVFSLGTFTSGTAVRHRYNVLPYLLISDSIILSKKKEYD